MIRKTIEYGAIVIAIILTIISFFVKPYSDQFYFAALIILVVLYTMAQIEIDHDPRILLLVGTSSLLCGLVLAMKTKLDMVSAFPLIIGGVLLVVSHKPTKTEK